METIKNSSVNAIDEEIWWLEKIIETQLALYFQNDCEYGSVYDHKPPDTKLSSSSYHNLINEHQFDFDERLVLILSIITQIKPQSLDLFKIKNQNLNCAFSEFGGIEENPNSPFIPTLETASFLLGGYKVDNRLTFMNKINEDHILYKNGILETDNENDFCLQQKLVISREYLYLFVTGKKALPQYSTRFPAKKISTKLEWEDLIVEEDVKESLMEIQQWLVHSELIMNDWRLKKYLKPGYRALFYGPPGTGKTMSAMLLGKYTKRPVFRVDLSMVVSKYVGETEKNLKRLFDEAESKEWILFFDEADALFGKRTQTKGSNDRYANQEVAYLLQRIEDFSGLVVLASNLQSNIDDAFSRRFQNTIYFPKPKAHERKLLWEQLVVNNFELNKSIVMDDIVKKYELTGGEMVNVLRYCAIRAAQRNEKTIQLPDILSGIKKEYSKYNKTI